VSFEDIEASYDISWFNFVLGYCFCCCLQAISFEILALYRKPKLFIFDLEKKMESVKKEYAKRQKEIETAKALTNSVSNSNSPAGELFY